MKNILYTLGISMVLWSCSGNDEPKNIELSGETVKVTAIQASGSNYDGNAIDFQLNGTVMAQESANISTRVMGNISRILVKEGQKVSQGQLLASISSTDLQAQKSRINAQIAEAEAGLKNAEKNYQRFKNLYESKSITQKEFNDVEMHYEMAQSRVKAAKEGLNELNVQLGYASVKAPFAGRISKKIANEGDMASPGMPLFTIESLGKLLIVVNVPEANMKDVKLNDEVQILIEALGKEMKGKVSLINPSAVQNGHQYKVEITLVGASPANLLAGMNAKVAFKKASTDAPKNEEAATTPEAIWLPKSALVEKGQLEGVYTVSNQQTAMLRWVQIGKMTDSQMEVLSGISPQDMVITQSEGKLYNGVKVQVGK